MTSTRTQALSYFTTGDAHRLAYRLDGADGMPVIRFSNSIATTFADVGSTGLVKRHRRRPMRAIQAIGDCEVRLEEMEDPAPRPGHAIVQVAAFSVNRGETYQLEQPRPGWRPGKDLAGTVVGAAPDGSGPPLGVRVVGHADDSGWAERALVPITRLAELPDHVSFVTAAALPLAGLAGAGPSRR